MGAVDVIGTELGPAAARARQQASGEERRGAAAAGYELALEPAPPALLSRRRLRSMLMAAALLRECERVLKKGGLNIVGEVLRGQGTFYEYDHYPADDVYDNETGAQYYYHAHRGLTGEHGHFHTFLRQPGSSAGRSLLSRAGRGPGCPAEGHAVHLIGISMNAEGWPIGLFATNHWVTGGEWRRAPEVLRMLPRFKVDHAYPSWPVNRWMSAITILFRPHIEALLRHRDAVIAAHGRHFPGRDPLEDRSLEVTGHLPIDVEEWTARLQAHTSRLRDEG